MKVLLFYFHFKDADFIQSKYDKNKDTLENFLNISKIIGISKKSFDAIIYNNNLKFDTSWMNDD